MHEDLVHDPKQFIKMLSKTMIAWMVTNATLWDRRQWFIEVDAETWKKNKNMLAYAPGASEEGSQVSHW